LKKRQETVENILRKLEGGDRRSIGRVNEVVAQVLRDPSLFAVLFRGMLGDDPVVRMRSADAAEKISAQHPHLLQEHRAVLLSEIAHSEQQEVRWHVAQMLPRLELTQEEQETAVEILLHYLDDDSKIVKTFSMQALADFAQTDASLRSRVVPLLEELTETGSPAVKSRGRKLLRMLATRSRPARD
jgi:HEAT repeat protein